MKTKRPLILIHLSLLHFFVDFLSVAPLFYAMRTGPIQAPSSLFIFFLLYNCCAFCCSRFLDILPIVSVSKKRIRRFVTI